MKAAVLGLLTACSLAACAAPRAERAAIVIDPPPAEGSWQADITPADASRLEGLDALWDAVRGHSDRRSQAALAAETPLLTAQAALEYPQLSPGSYRCRTVQVRVRHRRVEVKAYPPFFCFVKGEMTGKLSFAKQTGSDLPAGYLYPDGDRRYVFLGARQRQEGDNSIGYGVDPSRDVAGVIERIGQFRWRLVIPVEGDANGLDVYELTPVPAEQQPE